jgi:hypothetical protein
VSIDLEIESWRREWTFETEPLPELKRRIRGQNRRMIAGAVVIVVCLAFATVMGLRDPRSAWGGFAWGIWISTLLAGGYAMWVRRGTWAPAAPTTEAYVELLHRRAVATLRKTVVLRRSLVVFLAFYAVFVIWSREHVTTRSTLLVTAVALESLLMRALERRRRRAVEETARLVDRASDAPNTTEQKRMESE